MNYSNLINDNTAVYFYICNFKGLFSTFYISTEGRVTISVEKEELKNDSTKIEFDLDFALSNEIVHHK